MKQRLRLVAVCMTAVVLSACSSGASTSAPATDRSTTTAGSAAAPSTTAGAAGTTFIEAVTALQGDVRSAGTDLCKLRSVLESIGRTGDPQTRDDTVVAVKFVDLLYGAVARALDAQSDAKVRATAEIWRAAAAAVVAAGRKADYDPKSLDSGADLGLPDNFSDASQAFGDLTASCASAGN